MPAEVRDDVAGVIAPPPLIFLGGLAAGLALDAAMPDVDVPAGPSAVVGAALLLGGFGLMRAFFVALRRAGTHVHPGKPTTTIVTGGPYRLSRNPGYLGMALVFAGIAGLARAPWALVALAVVLVVVDRGVIAREERYLESRFGAPYARYKARVRRWV